jgi:hypothetical protein
MKVVFLPPAQAELDDAFSWYEEQAVWLGYEFLNELDLALRLVATFPALQPQMTKKKSGVAWSTDSLMVFTTA